MIHLADMSTIVMGAPASSSRSLSFASRSQSFSYPLTIVFVPLTIVRGSVTVAARNALANLKACVNSNVR